MTRKTLSLIKNKKNYKKITCLTAYTSSMAQLVDKYVDIILVGDSLGTTIYGMKNTQSVTLEMMMNHGKAVYNASKNAFTIIDMPINSYNSKKEALANALKLLKYSKCQSVKLETDKNQINIVKYLSDKKIKVVSHIGVTPQKYKNFNKIKSVGNNKINANKLMRLAVDLEKAGSCLIVLECIKENLAKEISKNLTIPTIGIGASVNCDGQVLVIDDILQIQKFEKKPRFVKTYANLNTKIENAIRNYCDEVINKKFPKKKNTY